MLLEDNIQKHPKAGNIDYDYAWAMYCHAKLSNFERAAEYYKIIRTRFPGWQRFGAGGANRNWDWKLKEVREIIEASDAPDAKEFVKQIRTIDREAEATR